MRKKQARTTTIIPGRAALTVGERVLIARIEGLEQEVQRLSVELEIEQHRLAACGVAALGYFESCCDEYKSASLSDTLRLRAEAEQLRQENEALRRCVRGVSSC